MGTIEINSLQYNAYHGFYDHEREEGNHFEVDLVFTFPIIPAAQSDDLTRTISYEEAQEIVNNIMFGTSRRLIETLAYEIGTELFNKFDFLDKLTVRLRKINPPMDTACHHSEIRLTWPLSASD